VAFYSAVSRQHVALQENGSHGRGSRAPCGFFCGLDLCSIKTCVNTVAEAIALQDIKCVGIIIFDFFFPGRDSKRACR
jgi:hypothetical protein